MTYLAYAPEQLRALSVAMRAALDELVTLSCDDPLAGDAVARVRLARVHLEQQWLPLLDRVVGTDPLGNPARLAVDDLGQSLLRIVATLPGWQLGESDADRLGAMPSSPPTAEQVTAFTKVLQDGDLEELTDSPQEREWLAAELTLIAADPALCATFAAGFDRWGKLGNRLGYRRQAALAHDVDQPVDDADRADVAHIDAAYAALGGIWTSVNGDGALVELTRTMEPYGAAVTISQLSLDPAALVGLSVEVLHRFDVDRDGYWAEDAVNGPKTGDLLLETILRTAGAPTTFVVAVADEPRLLWWTAADASLAQRVALVGTDPASIGIADAAVVLHAFADWFAHLQPAAQRNLVNLADPWESRATLGALAAPWFVEYGSGTDAWGVDPDIRRADLAFIIDDQGARGAMFEQLDAEAATLVGDPNRHRTEQAIAASIGMLLQIDTERRIRHAEEAKDEWDASWKLVQMFITYTGQAVPETLPVVKGLTKAMTRVKKLLDENGWLGAPPPPGDVATQAEALQERIRLACAATAVRAAYEALVERGDLPPIPPPPVPGTDPVDDPQSYRQAVRRWKDDNGVAPGSDADLWLDRQMDLFVSPYDEGADPTNG
jgi:hypothetical protein